jgi:hypothetical protein
VKNPEFNYSEFALSGFKKTFPILYEADPEAIAKWLFYTASGFAGRDGKSNAGGGELDIIALIGAASGVSIPIPPHERAREVKSELADTLRRAWFNNDHHIIFKKARDFERSAAMSVVDLRAVDWCDPHRIEEEIEKEAIEIPEAVAAWIEVVSEPTQAEPQYGNRSRSRERRRPIEHPARSLLEGVA